jgi:hypothetical protein
VSDIARQRPRRKLQVNPEVVKHVAEMVDGGPWQMADYLAETYPPEKYGNSKANTKLYEKLRDLELALHNDHGIILKESTMRKQRATAIAWPHSVR